MYKNLQQLHTEWLTALFRPLRLEDKNQEKGNIKKRKVEGVKRKKLHHQFLSNGVGLE